MAKLNDTGYPDDGSPSIDPSSLNNVNALNNTCPINSDTDSESVRGKPFLKGQSGNPNGRPRGARNRVSLALEELAYDKAGPIIDKIIEKALAGDQFAQRLFLDRILPRTRERPVTFEIPALGSALDAVNLMRSVLEAAAGGDLTLGQAEQVRAVVETYLKAREASEYERRLANAEDVVRTL